MRALRIVLKIHPNFVVQEKLPRTAVGEGPSPSENWQLLRWIPAFAGMTSAHSVSLAECY
jgi:hypothetical protein